MENLFNYKRTYKDINGEEYIDMCIPSLKTSNLEANSFVKLNETYNGRIDKFVWDFVSKDIGDGIDMVMYFNHIFNPFAIKEGDILFTPVDGSGEFMTQSEPELPDGSVLSSHSPETKQMTYAERIEYLSKLGFGVK